MSFFIEDILYYLMTEILAGKGLKRLWFLMIGLRLLKKVRPYLVVQMKEENILDYKSSAEARMKTTFNDSLGQKLKFLDVMWFSYEESYELMTHLHNKPKSPTQMRSGVDTHSAAEPWKKVNEANMKKRQKKLK